MSQEYPIFDRVDGGEYVSQEQGDNGAPLWRVVRNPDTKLWHVTAASGDWSERTFKSVKEAIHAIRDTTRPEGPKMAPDAPT